MDSYPAKRLCKHYPLALDWTSRFTAPHTAPIFGSTLAPTLYRAGVCLHIGITLLSTGGFADFICVAGWTLPNSWKSWVFISLAGMDRITSHGHCAFVDLCVSNNPAHLCFSKTKYHRPREIPLTTRGSPEARIALETFNNAPASYTKPLSKLCSKYRGTHKSKPPASH